MTYNTAGPHLPWFEHLVDSVGALGEAAREWQIADRTAQALEPSVEPLRRTLHGGKISVAGPETVGWDATPRPRRPHEAAVFDLQKIYMEHRFLTRRNYEHAALLFASGAAWAIARVQAGEQPDRVHVPLDEDRLPVPGDYKVRGLGNYVDAQGIDAAYQQVLSMQIAGDHAEELAGRDYVADHEASEMFSASALARELPDAAYAYGRRVERGLAFVLLGVKASHHRQRAERRAAQEQPE